MRQFRKAGSFVIGSLCLLTLSLLFVKISSAEPSIDWRQPWPQPGYQFGSFIPGTNGFEITVRKSEGSPHWGLQVISKRPINLSEGRYELTFTAKSSRAFTLCSRLGEESNRSNSYEEECWDIQGGKQQDKLSVVFKAKSIKNVLYFLIGYAPSDTQIYVDAISFRALP